MKLPKLLFRSIFAMAFTLFLLVAGVAGSASAATPAERTVSSVSASLPATDVVSSPSVCNAADTSATSGSDLLAVNRWNASTGTLHSRVGGIGLEQLNTLVQRNMMVSTGMMSGNFMWGTATNLSSFAINFCVLDNLGGAADGMAASIGNAIYTTPILAGIVVLSLSFLLFKGYRNGGAQAWKGMASKAMILGFFVIMLSGANASTGGGKDGDTGPYHPGTGSPGWFAVTLNNGVASFASAAPGFGVQLAGWTPTNTKTTDFTQCKPYTDQLKNNYISQYGSGVGAYSATVPLVLSGMWETTGMSAWKAAQFGTFSKGLTESTYCHLLEMNAGSQVNSHGDGANASNQQAALLDAIATQGNINVNPLSKAFRVSDNTEQDRSIIAWAVCQPTGGDVNSEGGWTVRPEFADGAFSDGSKTPKPSNCADWWSKPDADLGAFDWSDSRADVTKYTTLKNGAINTSAQSFLLNLHGNDNGSGIVAVFAYNLSAFCMLIVFGALSLTTLFAKLGTIVVICTIFLMMIMFLLPNAESRKMLGMLKFFGGLVIYQFMVQLIFSLIAGLTTFFTKGTDGSPISLIWTGLAPVVSVVILHMLFTKVLKMPSPFALSSGMAYASAIGNAGGGAVSNLGGLVDRRQNGLASSASKGLKAGKKMLTGKMGGAAAGRKGSMASALSGKSTAAAAVAGATGTEVKASPKRYESSKGASEALKGLKTSEIEDLTANAVASSDLPKVKRVGSSGTQTVIGGVLNSEMKNHGATATERNANRLAAKAELEAAEKYAKVEADAAREAAKAAKSAQPKRSINDHIGAAWAVGVNGAHAGRQAFAANPVRNSALGLGVVAGVAVTGFAAPAAAIIGGGILAKKAVQNRSGTLVGSARRAARADEKVGAYREAQLQKTLELKAERDAEAKAKLSETAPAVPARRPSAPRNTQQTPASLSPELRRKASQQASRSRRTNYSTGGARTSMA